MGKSRLEQCQSTKELKYETTLRSLQGNLSELFLFEFGIVRDSWVTSSYSRTQLLI